ncbi:MAG: ABC transporter permease subunit [Chitinophagaceae bacterium]
MWPIWKKEFSQYFSSLTGFIAILVFLLLNGFILFVLPDTNVFDFGYATLDKFFFQAPWILSLLLPAITMRSFSDEFRSGTYETLVTRPVTKWQIITGKYFGSLSIAVIALLPTIVYAICIQQLAEGDGIDGGAAIGSYIGLFFLSAAFIAIGIFCSSLSINAVVAFLLSAVSCLLLYTGFSLISRIPVFVSGADYYIEMLGMDFYYRSISRGVVDSRDVIYFLSLIFFFLFMTRNRLKSN